MSSDGDRNTARQSFDRVAHLYQKVRPDYPDELFDHLVKVTDMRPDNHLLEVGCATGKPPFLWPVADLLSRASDWRRRWPPKLVGT
jgi:hypothetical protein